MAGRGARSDRGNVRGALVDEFTHVITGGTTRNCVLKQSSTLLRRCSAQCRRREAGRHSGCGRGTGCLFGTNAAREPPGENCTADGARTAVLRPRERPDSLSARSPYSAGNSLSGRTVTYGDSRQSRPSRDIRRSGRNTSRARISPIRLQIGVICASASRAANAHLWAVSA